MKVVDRDPKFAKPDWVIGKTFTCTTCNRDYMFDAKDVELMEPFLNGKKCGPMVMSEEGRRIDFTCCGCNEGWTVRYYDFYCRNW